MFDEKDIIDAARKVAADDTVHTLVHIGFLAFAEELQRISNEKQKAWEKRHKLDFDAVFEPREP